MSMGAFQNLIKKVIYYWIYSRGQKCNKLRAISKAGYCPTLAPECVVLEKGRKAD